MIPRPTERKTSQTKRGEDGSEVMPDNRTVKNHGGKPVIKEKVPRNFGGE